MNETTVQEAAPRVASSSASPAVDDRPVALELIDLRKHFGSGERRVPAVDGVDLSIRRGEVVALLGPNGAGKPTPLDMPLGLTAPSRGKPSRACRR